MIQRRRNDHLRLTEWNADDSSVYREIAWMVLPNTWGVGPSVPPTSWDYVADIQKYKDPKGYYWWNNI